MSKRPRLIFTGQVIADLVLRVDALPEPGGDVLASSSTITAGGGFNVMVAAKRDGLPVVFAGRYGSGPFADVVRKALCEQDIEAIQAPADRDTGYCVVLVDASAERTFVTVVGAEATVDAADLAGVDVRPDDLVYLTGYSLAHPRNAAALRAWLPTLASRTRVVVDASPLIGTLEPELVALVLARADVLTVNSREAQILSGRTDARQAARALLSRVRAGGAVLVRDGAAGTLVATATSVEHVPAPVVEAVDSNGAGDAHTGVFMAALARGDDVVSAVLRANVAAAIAVTRAGPATSPSAVEIDAALGAKRPQPTSVPTTSMQ